VILPEVLVLPRPLFLLRHKDGGGLLLKKYTQGFEGEMRGFRIEHLGGRS
jgi:hypothetical protein